MVDINDSYQKTREGPRWAVGSWQLAVGSWQLAVGSWQLAVSLLNQAFGSRTIFSHERPNADRLMPTAA